MDAKVSQSEFPNTDDSMSKFYDILGKLGESRARNRSNPRFEKVKEWVPKIHEAISEHLLSVAFHFRKNEPRDKMIRLSNPGASTNCSLLYIPRQIFSPRQISSSLSPQTSVSAPLIIYRTLFEGPTRSENYLNNI